VRLYLDRLDEAIGQVQKIMEMHPDASDVARRGIRAARGMLPEPRREPGVAEGRIVET